MKNYICMYVCIHIMEIDMMMYIEGSALVIMYVDLI